MSSGTEIKFDYSEVIANVDKLKERLKPALTMVTETMAKKMEGWAQENARWTDRTGNARQDLTGRHYWEDAQTVVAEISHGVEYGYWLEVAHNKKYAILEDSLEANKDAIMKAWRAVVSG